MKKILLLCLLSLAASCATATKQAIESDRVKVGKVKNEKDVVKKAREVLAKSKISEKQKQQFVDLYRSHRAEADSIEEKIREYRVVLLKTLVAKNFSQRKFDIVANKIKKLVLKRYDLSMKQYKEGKKILGVDAGSVYDDPWFEIMHKF
ncbi:hypothetical protein [Halobacteriovorax sp. JY17]|uniref:hypothetical protein n=1 Tax=Halobacteriovorax sp. JY17 TaxID=2014617 RepID=UPI000C678043|nr:hypothetical protein [Halobacteriovorax sp. JY17]PIK15946.1 MAG: hypothetical protein CES88_04250 [Halobacteriovorax sp. JY17]